MTDSGSESIPRKRRKMEIGFKSIEFTENMMSEEDHNVSFEASQSEIISKSVKTCTQPGSTQAYNPSLVEAHTQQEEFDSEDEEVQRLTLGFQKSLNINKDPEEALLRQSSNSSFAKNLNSSLRADLFKDLMLRNRVYEKPQSESLLNLYKKKNSDIRFMSNSDSGFKHLLEPIEESKEPGLDKSDILDQIALRGDRKYE